MFGGGTGLEQQRRRPPPAAETGSRGWDSVLIFQSPAKGLRKNQQTQPVQAPAVRFRQGFQRLGMSTGMTAVLWWTVQDENRNEQRQGITMMVVSCLLLLYRIARAPCSRPVPLPPQNKKSPDKCLRIFMWWRIRDSNPRPPACDAGALTS